MGLKLVQQLAQRRINRFFMDQFAKSCVLACARACAVFRHIGGLIPTEHGTRRTKIANLKEAALEFRELSLNRPFVT